MLLVPALAGLVAHSLPAQTSQASLEITVIATPTGGRDEPVRGHTFFLLRESLDAIEQTARAENPAPQIEEFADGADLSDALKEWIKRTGVADFRGEKFLKALKPDDVMDITEFHTAYVESNQSMVGLGFPRHKGKLTDREKKPRKWEKQSAAYESRLSAYIVLHPESREAMERELIDLNPGPEWARRQQAYEARLRRAVMRLIHNRYLAGRGETNLDGKLRFVAPPGLYYVTNLWEPARSGDLMLRWELAVELPAPIAYRFELNNANALEPELPDYDR